MHTKQIRPQQKQPMAPVDKKAPKYLKRKEITISGNAKIKGNEIKIGGFIFQIQAAFRWTFKIKIEI
jgi:hypothetical protein